MTPAVQIVALKADGFGRVACFHAAHRLLREVHARGIARNDRFKEAHRRVLDAARPVRIDFPLAPGMKAYRLVTRAVLHRQDNEGRGPMP